jgi:hypothetical protein
MLKSMESDKFLDKERESKRVRFLEVCRLDNERESKRVRLPSRDEIESMKRQIMAENDAKKSLKRLKSYRPRAETRVE